MLMLMLVNIIRRQTLRSKRCSITGSWNILMMMVTTANFLQSLRLQCVDFRHRYQHTGRQHPDVPQGYKAAGPKTKDPGLGPTCTKKNKRLNQPEALTPKLVVRLASVLGNLARQDETRGS